MLKKIRSNHILRQIFQNIKKKRVLNLLKFNKNFQNKFNFKKEDFKEYLTLREINEKFSLNIEDNDKEKLDLKDEYLNKEILNYFDKIHFKELKELDLSYNKIDINTYILGEIPNEIKFEKLIILNLNNNQISNINILQNFNCAELKELNLRYNNITDITPLEKVKFEKLEILNLDMNNIYDIKILEKVNFKELKGLKLKYNYIIDINVFEKVDFPKLELLDLEHNSISNLSVLEKANFKELKELNLFFNPIDNMKIFEKINFVKLEKLYVNIMEYLNLIF